MVIWNTKYFELRVEIVFAFEESLSKSSWSSRIIPVLSTVSALLTLCS